MQFFWGGFQRLIYYQRVFFGAIDYGTFSPFIGRLSDKIEPRVISSIRMSLTLIALLNFAFINKTIELFLIITGLVVLGLGLAFFSSPNNNAILSSVEKKFYGVASGTLSTMRVIGQMFNMGIAMLIFALIIGRVQITSEYHPHFLLSIKTIFMIFAVLCFGGIFASLARGKVH
jgi:MFS family permease